MAIEPADPDQALRVGDRDRDAVVQRLQQAFAAGRLDDEEFDHRTRAALTARLTSDLAVLTTDLPAGTAALRPVAPGATGVRAPGRLAIAYKSAIRRGGRWRVPTQFLAVVYKGSGRLDLRAAELSGPVTTLHAIAYKSRIDVLVPPGVRVELDGFGVSKGGRRRKTWRAACPPTLPSCTCAVSATRARSR
ncbi:MAG: DUF1707 SHOCT-like domain-containing protein [Streptosporangiaceae bacterium]